MNITAAMRALDNLEMKLNAYAHACGLLNYDAATAAPEKSVARRGRTLEVLGGADFDLMTCKRTIGLIEYLSEHSAELPPLYARRTELLRRRCLRTVKIPKAEYIAYENLVNEAQHVWQLAKPANDFASFAPFLEKLVQSSLRLYGYTDPGKDPYDAALDEYERGLDRARLDVFFDELRTAVVPLIKSVGAAEQPDDGFLYRYYPADKQRLFSDRLMSAMGIDRSRCIIGETLHPFTENFGRDDVRITTHYDEHGLASSMYSVVHEGGHALYELGSGEDLEGTAAAGGASMSIHESQSRLYENMIGRGRGFTSYILPAARELFPEQLDGVDEEGFYRAVNVSRPSLIRTEADELTYPLHIMVRYEIEKLLFAGEGDVRELPGLWAEKMREYLGVEVPDDRRGVLQDSHWSSGAFGYFPSYALGSAYAAQIYAAMSREIDPEALAASGRACEINAWLEKRLWRFGNSMDPSELLENCCGEQFSPAYYTDYLSAKFRGLYNI